MIRSEKLIAVFGLSVALGFVGCGGSEKESPNPVVTSPGTPGQSPDPIANKGGEKPAEAPKEEAKPAEAPKAEAKPAEAPKAEAKPADAPKADAKAASPKLESPK